MYCVLTSGDTVGDRTLFGTVSKNAIFCFDSMMLLLHIVLSLIMCNNEDLLHIIDDVYLN